MRYHLSTIPRHHDKLGHEKPAFRQNTAILFLLSAYITAVTLFTFDVPEAAVRVTAFSAGRFSGASELVKH